MLAGFAVKVPLFPVHTWLPLAHTEAPTAGSVILAGVLLKLGTYGLLRLAVPIGHLPRRDARSWRQFIGVLCLIGIIYGALVAWVQQDIKKLVAYSSVSHLGFCVLGLLALNATGRAGLGPLHDQPRPEHRGAVPGGRHDLRPLPHARHQPALGPGAARCRILAFFFVLFTLSEHRPARA